MIAFLLWESAISHILAINTQNVATRPLHHCSSAISIAEIVSYACRRCNATQRNSSPDSAGLQAGTRSSYSAALARLRISL
jgi:hypothetical protein